MDIFLVDERNWPFKLCNNYRTLIWAPVLQPLSGGKNVLGVLCPAPARVLTSTCQLKLWLLLLPLTLSLLRMEASWNLYP